MAEFTLEHPEKHDAKHAELLGRVLNLTDLVQYQSGTVASRMIVNRKAGSITLFSFDEDEGLSEHTSPYDAVILTTFPYPHEGKRAEISGSPREITVFFSRIGVSFVRDDGAYTPGNGP